MDTMNWAGQTCGAVLQMATPLLIQGALLTVLLLTLAWIAASLTTRPRIGVGYCPTSGLINCPTNGHQRV